jgi:hypothetical protein
MSKSWNDQKQKQASEKPHKRVARLQAEEADEEIREALTASQEEAKSVEDTA